ncbi:MAG: 16S rRNA (guanine(527)-N(7))-methyltransferase RsmG [Myxococcota bacterium]|nr:16S rRNA (guanine(527)-N(7))-methyltransferase RsmG [Myxococcota bacterium]
MKHPNLFIQALSQEPLAEGLTKSQMLQMEAHWRQVLAWNARTNLTAITDDRSAAAHHYADSLAAQKYLKSGPVLDIGSGGGFPGIPLAIARPDLEVTLLEPRRKRVSFLSSAVARQGLNNVTVIHGRIQDTPNRLHASAVTRATFSCAQDLMLCLNWLSEAGDFFAYRAVSSEIMPGATRSRYQAGGTAKVLDRLARPNDTGE